MRRNIAGNDWSAQGRKELIADGGKSRGDRARALLQAASQAKPAEQLSRPGITAATAQRYASTASPETWAQVGGGRPLVEAVLQSIHDGADRELLGWPERPGNAFTLAAIALREARSSGRLASATLAVWPWRTGLTRAARSVLVHPADLAAAARAAATDHQRGEDWVSGPLSQQSLHLIELRMRDLISQNAPPRVRRAQGRFDVVVRSPTLLETTTVFAPGRTGYSKDDGQILKRVREHTHLGDAGADLPKAFAEVGDPSTSPFALFGVPAENSVARLQRMLGRPSARHHGLDAVIVDLTRQTRTELSDQWEPLFACLLEALDEIPGRRPPIIALCDDSFSLRAAARALRMHNAAMRPRRPPPREVGAYLAEPGLLPPVSSLPARLAKIAFSADIKDAALVDIRTSLVQLAHRFRRERDGDAVHAVNGALTFLRRAASLPVGLREARQTVDVLFDIDDEVDARIKAMFRPLMALAPLAKLADTSSAAASVREVLDQIAARAEAWNDETPVSAKLLDLMDTEAWNAPTTLVAVPERRVAEILIASDRSVQWSCAIVDHRELGAALLRGAYERLIVIGATPVAIRGLLTSVMAPDEVLLLGDAAGSGLILAELAPLSRIEAFAPVAKRAADLLAALERGGLNEKLEAGESELTLFPQPRSADIDLSREGAAYSGEKVVLVTGANRVVYRANSDVLVFSPGEIRPFERVAAREVERGDQILVLDEAVRERVRRALATSRSSLAQLAAYHAHIASLRAGIPGKLTAEKVREVLRRMREIDPALSDTETANIQRWLTADLAPAAHDGARQPRAARDWGRFRLFMRVIGVDDVLAETYWRFAIVPTRSYRVQEGHLFNQRVVQFVLDPEGVSAGAGGWRSLKDLWLSLVDAVDDVLDVKPVPKESRN